MVCQKCGMKPAIIHYANMVNGNKLEVHLCEECAKAKENAIISGINDLMSGFLGIKTAENSNLLKCCGCGSTQKDISENGKAGCEHCYEVFSKYMTPIIRKVHGTDTHVGKVPQKVPQKEVQTVMQTNMKDNSSREKLENEDKIEKLENSMKEAIAAEKYEEAAVIRDELVKLREKEAAENEHME